MTQTQAIVALIDDYFNVAYEPTSRDFDQIFHPSCLVQWLHEGRLETLTAPDYAALVHGRPSPRSTGAPRDDAILALENISDCWQRQPCGCGSARSSSTITSSCTRLADAG